MSLDTDPSTNQPVIASMAPSAAGAAGGVPIVRSRSLPRPGGGSSEVHVGALRLVGIDGARRIADAHAPFLALLDALHHVSITVHLTLWLRWCGLEERRLKTPLPRGPRRVGTRSKRSSGPPRRSSTRRRVRGPWLTSMWRRSTCRPTATYGSSVRTRSTSPSRADGCRVPSAVRSPGSTLVGSVDRSTRRHPGSHRPPGDLEPDPADP